MTHAPSLPQVGVTTRNSPFELNDDVHWVTSWTITFGGEGAMNFSTFPPYLSLSHRFEHTVIGHTVPSERRRQGTRNHTREADETNPASTSLGYLAQGR